MARTVTADEEDSRGADVEGRGEDEELVRARGCWTSWTTMRPWRGSQQSKRLQKTQRPVLSGRIYTHGAELRHVGDRSPWTPSTSPSSMASFAAFTIAVLDDSKDVVVGRCRSLQTAFIQIQSLPAAPDPVHPVFSRSKRSQPFAWILDPSVIIYILVVNEQRKILSFTGHILDFMRAAHSTPAVAACNGEHALID